MGIDLPCSEADSLTPGFLTTPQRGSLWGSVDNFCRSKISHFAYFAYILLSQRTYWIPFLVVRKMERAPWEEWKGEGRRGYLGTFLRWFEPCPTDR
jgi:hypothetical protein